jgi:hypothetical protein
MSSKISALPAQGFVMMADQFVCIDATPTDFRVTKLQLLNAAPAESIQLQNGTSFVGIDASGKILLSVVAPDDIFIGDSAGSQLVIGTTGILSMAVPFGVSMVIGNGACVLTWNGLGDLIVSATPGRTLTVTYFEAVPANWIGPPADIWAALDRIAAAIVARTVGGPI